jgi:hypothetical protein
VSDYRTYIDGRTREDGIRCFLAARGIKLPEGSRKDGPHRMTIKGLAARKQQLFAEEIASLESAPSRTPRSYWQNSTPRAFPPLW